MKDELIMLKQYCPLSTLHDQQPTSMNEQTFTYYNPPKQRQLTKDSIPNYTVAAGFKLVEIIK